LLLITGVGSYQRARTPEPRENAAPTIHDDEPHDDASQDDDASQEDVAQEDPLRDTPVAERRTRSGRNIRMPERYRAQRATTDIATPTTYDEAIAGPQKRQWEIAIADELRSMAINNVWELVDCPQGANLVSCKWVFKVKRLPNGNIDKLKARLVARGFTQRYGIDYDETFAPVGAHGKPTRIARNSSNGRSRGSSNGRHHSISSRRARRRNLHGTTAMPTNHGQQGLSTLDGLKQSARVWN